MSKEFNPTRKEKFTVPQALAVLLFFGVVLVAMAVMLNHARALNRDIKRLADVAILQSALELYFQDCSAYPKKVVSGQPLSAEVCRGGIHLREVPFDPSGDSYKYLPCEGLEENRNCAENVAFPTSYVLGYELERGVDNVAAGRYTVKP